MQKASTRDITLMMPCLNCLSISVTEIKWETSAEFRWKRSLDIREPYDSWCRVINEGSVSALVARRMGWRGKRYPTHLNDCEESRKVLNPTRAPSTHGLSRISTRE